jgi:GxxExxY protein
MPIRCCFDIAPISQSHFHEVDHLVMHHAFDIQNELGRLYNESIYHAELIRRCSESGLAVVSEGEIVVSLESFKKSYYLDALISSGSIYELKAVADLNEGHESQLLNYLFLSNVHHGKLINFISPSVQYRFVSTNINSERRFSFLVDTKELDDGLSSSPILKSIILKVLGEWGAFLDIGLYKDAVAHFLGGEDALIRPVDICVNNQVVGHQDMCLLNAETGLHISSVIRHPDTYGKQLSRMLEHTSLKQIQWLNFNRETIQLITLKK